MNDPPLECNITLVDAAVDNGGCLIDYRQRCNLTHKSKRFAHPKRTGVQRNDVFGMGSRGTELGLKLHASTMKEKRDNQVYFYLRRRLVERPDLKRTESDDDMFWPSFENPTHSQQQEKLETKKHKETSKCGRLSLALGQRTKSVDRSISDGDSTKDIVSLRHPGRTVIEPIRITRQQYNDSVNEITVNFSGATQLTRKIHEWRSLEEATGLKGIDCLRPGRDCSDDCCRHTCISLAAQDDCDLCESDSSIRDLCKSSKQKVAQRNRLQNGIIMPHDRDEFGRCASVPNSTAVTSVISRDGDWNCDVELRRRCYTWYTRLGQPTREDMKRRVARMAFSCDIKPDDVDKMDWILNGERVSFTAMNESLKRKTSLVQPLQQHDVKTDTAPCEVCTAVTPQSPNMTMNVDHQNVPSRSVGWIAMDAKKDQVHKNSCESESATNKDNRSTVPDHTSTRSGNKPFLYDEETKKKQATPCRRSGYLLEGLSLQHLLNELQSSRAPRSSRSPKQYINAHLGSDVLGSRPCKRLLPVDHPNEITRKQNIEKLHLKRLPQHTVSQCHPKYLDRKHDDLTVVDRRPWQALLKKEQEAVPSNLVEVERKQPGEAGNAYEGSATAPLLSKISHGHKRLDPAVASFLGIDASNAEFTVCGRKREGRRPAFVQALSIFSAKITSQHSPCATITTTNKSIKTISRALR